MNTSGKISIAVMGGIIATAIFSLMTIIAPFMGLPEMSPPAMLAAMMRVPAIVGWMGHFIIGIVFAVAYVLFFDHLIRKIKGTILKGIVFGFAAFLFAQIALAIMDALLGGMPAMQGNMMLVMVESIAGHLIYGIVVVWFIQKRSASPAP